MKQLYYDVADIAAQLRTNAARRLAQTDKEYLRELRRREQERRISLQDPWEAAAAYDAASQPKPEPNRQEEVPLELAVERAWAEHVLPRAECWQEYLLLWVCSINLRHPDTRRPFVQLTHKTLAKNTGTTFKTAAKWMRKLERPSVLTFIGDDSRHRGLTPYDEDNDRERRKITIGKGRMQQDFDLQANPYCCASFRPRSVRRPDKERHKANIERKSDARNILALPVRPAGKALLLAALDHPGLKLAELRRICHIARKPSYRVLGELEGANLLLRLPGGTLYHC